jgi:hypothetical protein
MQQDAGDSGRGDSSREDSFVVDSDSDLDSAVAMGDADAEADADASADGPTPDPGRPVEVAVGQFTHACARTAAGRVRCWGDETHGELGDGSTSDRATPGPPIPGLDGVVRIAAGQAETCAIKSDRTVWCWGQARFGLLGDGVVPGPDVVDRPTRIPGIDDAQEVAVGTEFVAVIRSDRSLWTWGVGTWGQLGYETTAPCDSSGSGETCSGTPMPVTAIGKIATVSVGDAHSCVVRQDDGAVWCWGENGHGSLGDGSTTSRYEPKPVVGLDPAALVIAGLGATGAVTKTGAFFRWGMPEDYHTPTSLTGFSAGISSVGLGDDDCAILVDGSVECWWIASSGASPGSPAPLIFPGSALPISTMASEGFACAIGSDSAIYCWGAPYYLGDGTYLVSTSIPVKVAW